MIKKNSIIILAVNNFCSCERRITKHDSIPDRLIQLLYEKAENYYDLFEVSLQYPFLVFTILSLMFYI